MAGRLRTYKMILLYPSKMVPSLVHIDDEGDIRSSLAIGNGYAKTTPGSSGHRARTWGLVPRAATWPLRISFALIPREWMS